MTENKEQIIIIGAGIAGLSLAIQLTEKKIPCVVLEARTNFNNLTTGVRISAKGVKVLENMGIRDIGENTEKLLMYFGRRKVVFDINNTPNTSPANIVTRLAVFEKLRTRINELGIPVMYNFKLENLIENAHGVTGISTDGQKISGKYLVGADGVGSIIRRILNPNSSSAKRYAGYLGLGFIYPSEEKIEMSLFNNINGNIGLGSVGKIKPADNYKNNFMWLHIHMNEAEAQAITDEEVYRQVSEKANSWPPYLQNVFQKIKSDPKAILYHLPVYNGSVPAKWYSNRIFLIGDAAHPYGPGGQGISMALMDAEALSDLFVSGITEEKKMNFQTTRAAVAKEKGESAEERNKPENQVSTLLGLWWKSILMRGFHLLKGGKIEL
jgi:2-polyprenyl-6-methoxyphenol hydroxylase-like FAD-dependent oxidoreductase